MQGYVAVTDPGWYDRLSHEPGPMDANFWRPSARRINLAVGTPFLFKLKAPHNTVAGFGFFAGFTILPDWLAWETFGRANGVDSFEGLRAQLRRIQVGARIEADPAGRIGCCLIAEARFFPRDEWIRPPSDWHRTTQVGAPYDLSVGDGQRIWQECLSRATPTESAFNTPASATDPPPRYGAPATYRPRLGQGIFRIQVLDAYDRACAVTREHSLPVLEAAHIRPYSSEGAHEVANGLTLRTDLHRLFDKGYVTVDENLRLVVGRRLKDEFANGRTYYGLNGHGLALPSLAALRPSLGALAWHRENVFLG